MTERWRKLKRFVIFRILHADDSPRRIALGVALGLFIAMTPTIGVQMLIALSLAALLRVNKAAAVTIVWVSNPITMVYIYYQNWRIGRFVLQSNVSDDSTISKHLEDISASIGGFSHVFSHLFDWTFWKEVLSLLWGLGLELWVGSFIVALVCALPGYFLAQWLVTAYRQKFPRPRLFRRSRRDRSRPDPALPSSRPKLRKKEVGFKV